MISNVVGKWVFLVSGSEVECLTEQLNTQVGGRV